MQVTSTSIAVALAVVVALGFLFFGSALFTPLGIGENAPAAMTDTASSTQPIDSNQPSMDTTSASTQTLPSGLAITDLAAGTGAEVKAGDTVVVNYTGMLENGTVFDASAKHGGPATFAIGVGQVIKGWDEGIVGMKVGGKRRLVIPSDLAYGAQGIPQAGIPGGATLVFDVELVGIQ